MRISYFYCAMPFCWDSLECFRSAGFDRDDAVGVVDEILKAMQVLAFESRHHGCVILVFEKLGHVLLAFVASVIDFLGLEI